MMNTIKEIPEGETPLLLIRLQLAALYSLNAIGPALPCCENVNIFSSTLRLLLYRLPHLQGHDHYFSIS